MVKVESHTWRPWFELKVFIHFDFFRYCLGFKVARFLSGSMAATRFACSLIRRSRSALAIPRGTARFLFLYFSWLDVAADRVSIASIP